MCVNETGIKDTFVFDNRYLYKAGFYVSMCGSLFGLLWWTHEDAHVDAAHLPANGFTIFPWSTRGGNTKNDYYKRKLCLFTKKLHKAN